MQNVVATSVAGRDRPTPLSSLVGADIARLRDEDRGLRTLLRGVASQGFLAIVVYRLFHWCYERRIPTQPFRFVVERFVEITTGISLPAPARIGKGLRIHHFGGVIVNSDAVIGENCTLYHGVTLGDRGGWGGSPYVGNGVTIGAGAKVLGSIEVGNDCFIGANAVVCHSVPSGFVAVGVPAVARKRKADAATRSVDPSGDTFAPESGSESPH